MMPKLTDLQPDNRNANKGTARGQKMIVASLQEDGFGRSGLLDKNGKIIAGNKTAEASAEVFGVDSEVVIVETDGTKPVYVKRTDLDLETDVAARRLAYRDNLASHFSFEMDPDVVMADIEAGFDFEAINVSLGDLGLLLENSTDPDDEWQGMPSFQHEDKTSYQAIHVHFKSASEVAEFAELLGKKITDRTRSIWFKEQEQMDDGRERYTTT